MAVFSILGKQRMIEELHEAEVVWHSHLIHCLDFEGSRRSGVVEYGLVTIRDLDVVSMETRLCRGTGSIPEIESSTHHIRDEDVLSTESVSADWELFRDKRASGPFAAHHASVENGLIKSIWPYTAQSFNYISGIHDVDWGPWLDTCALYRALFPGLESYNLASLIQRFQWTSKLDQLAKKYCPKERISYHCAAYDALASAVLLLQLENYQELKSLTLSQLLQWSQPGSNHLSQGNQMELL